MYRGYWMWKARETILKRNDRLKVRSDGARKLGKTSAKPLSLFSWVGVVSLGRARKPSRFDVNPAAGHRAGEDAPLGRNGRDTEAATARRAASRPCCIFRSYRLWSRCNALWHMHPAVSMNAHTHSRHGRRAVWGPRSRKTSVLIEFN